MALHAEDSNEVTSPQSSQLLSQSIKRTDTNPSNNLPTSQDEIKQQLFINQTKRIKIMHHLTFLKDALALDFIPKGLRVDPYR